MKLFLKQFVFKYQQMKKKVIKHINVIFPQFKRKSVGAHLTHHIESNINNVLCMTKVYRKIIDLNCCGKIFYTDNI